MSYLFTYFLIVVAELNDQGYNSVGTVVCMPQPLTIFIHNSLWIILLLHFVLDSFISLFWYLDWDGIQIYSIPLHSMVRTITKETISIQEYQVVAGFFFFYIALGISQAICVAISEVFFDSLPYLPLDRTPRIAKLFLYSCTFFAELL